jgi:Delta7-sterol 5-desaturase
MLCEIGENYGYIAVWATLSVLGAIATITLSSIVFVPYYAYPTYEKWTRKCNPKYPSPALVRKEIIQSLKGVAIGVLCPAFALYSSANGLSQGYCGDPKGIGITGHLIQTLIIIGFSDFVEYGYHWSSLFPASSPSSANPTPFAVIADELIDQCVRFLPLVFLPAVLPINMDLLFLIFSTLFYGYGVYLHWGYESPYLASHITSTRVSEHHVSERDLFANLF